jgi:hypothetical protein
VDITDNIIVGGLVGFNNDNATVSNCLSRDNVTRSSGTGTDFGGFAGYNKSATIEYCYSTGSDLVCLNNQIGDADYSYTDNTVQPDETYTCRLSDVDIQGNIAVLQEIEVTTTDVTHEKNTIIPERTELLPAYPNPFNPETTISYKLAETVEVDIQIYNVLGKKVLHLINHETQQVGELSAIWDGTGDNSKSFTSGIYIVSLKAGDYIKSLKVQLLR